MSSSSNAAFRFLTVLCCGVLPLILAACDDSSEEKEIDLPKDSGTVVFIDSGEDEDAELDAGDEDAKVDSGDNDAEIDAGDVCLAVPLSVLPSGDDNEWKAETTLSSTQGWLLNDSSANESVRRIFENLSVFLGGLRVDRAAVFKFDPLNAEAYWSFSTAGSKLSSATAGHSDDGEVWDSILVVARDCEANDIIAFNDDDLELTSTVDLNELAGNQPYYLFVLDGSTREPDIKDDEVKLVLTASCATGTKPTVEMSDVRYNAQMDGYVAIEVSGTDAEGDVTGLLLRFLGKNGQFLRPDMEDSAGNVSSGNAVIPGNRLLPEEVVDGEGLKWLYVPFLSLTTGSDQFTGQWAMYTHLSGDSAITKVQFQVIDQRNLTSAAKEVYVGDSSPIVLVGGICDPDNVMKICQSGTSCVCTASNCTCQAPDKPQVKVAQSKFVKNVSSGYHGFEVVGVDKQGDVAGIEYRLATINYRVTGNCTWNDILQTHLSQCLCLSDDTANAGCLSSDDLSWSVWYRSDFDSISVNGEGFNASIGQLNFEENYVLAEVRVYDRAGHYAVFDMNDVDRGNAALINEELNAQGIAVSSSSRLILKRLDAVGAEEDSQCDLSHTFYACAQGTFCQQQADGVSRCKINTAPKNLTGEFAINSAKKTLSYEFSVTDTEHNISYFVIRLYDSSLLMINESPFNGTEHKLYLADAMRYGTCQSDDSLVWVRSGFTFTNFDVSRVQKMTVTAYDSEGAHSGANDLSFNQIRVNYQECLENSENLGSSAVDLSYETRQIDFCHDNQSDLPESDAAVCSVNELIACDPYGAFDDCSSMFSEPNSQVDISLRKPERICRMGRQSCATDAVLYADYYCLKSKEPVVTSFEAYLNQSIGAVYIKITGEDEQCDVESIRIQQPDGLVLRMPFKQLAFDTEGKWWGATWFYSEAWNHMSEPKISGWTVIDSAGLEVDFTNSSANREIVFNLFSEDISRDDSCDPVNARGECGGDKICVARQNTEDSNEPWLGSLWGCKEAADIGYGCPDWQARTLTVNEPASGSTANSPLSVLSKTCDYNHSSDVCCSNGGPAEVWFFKAEESGGRYVFKVEAESESAGNPLLFAREKCVLDNSELTCDTLADGSRSHSEITLNLTGGQEIYLFVSGYEDVYHPGFYGAYRLTATKQ